MRLIDADKFEVVVLNGKSDEFCDGAEYILEMLDNAPTVDIKTEVAREIFAEIKSSYKDRIFIDIDELEKKYTEVNK